MAVHVNEQLFYKPMRGVQPQNHMLLYAGEAVYPTIEFDTFARQNLASDPIRACRRCGNLCQSDIAAIHHETFTCPGTIPRASRLREQMMSPHQHVGGGIKDMERTNASTTTGGDHDSDSSSHDTTGSDLDDKSNDSYLEPAESGSGGDYKCDECPKSFQWKANLQRHQLTHDADRKFPCENCDKVFTDPSNLQRHIRSQHVGARSHACSECGKTFATSSGLKQHQHIHSSFKPFQCEVCLKAYTQFSNLCRHKRMHADCRQQIRCKDCGQAFSTVTSLSKHRRFCEGGTGSGKETDYIWDNPSPMPGSDGTGHLASPLYSYSFTDHPARSQLPFSLYPHFGTIPLQMPHGLPAIMGVSPLPGSPALFPTHNGQHCPAHIFDVFGETDQTEDTVRSLKRRSAVTIGSPSSEMSDASSSEGSGNSDADMKDVLDDDSTHSTRRRQALETCQPESQFMKQSATRVPTLQTCSTAPESSSSRDNNSDSEVKTASPGFAHLRHQSTHVSETGGTMYVPVQSPNLVFTCEASSDHSSSPVRTELSPPSATSADVISPQTADMVIKTASGQQQEMPLDLSKKPVNSLTLSVKGSTRHAHNTRAIAISSASSSSPMSSSSTPTSSITPTAPESSLTLPFVPLPGLKGSTISPFPYSLSPFMMESLLRLKEGIKLQQVATTMFPPFNTSNPTAMPGFRPRHFGFLSRPEFRTSSPLFKLNTDPNYSNHETSHNTFHSNHQQRFDQRIPGKSKERYACKYCGKLFPRSANLTRHLRTHTGEQPYKCRYCERSFSISSNLQRHVRNIHNKEKPFRCQICDRRFGQQTNLDRHVKKHEQEGPQVSESPTAELEDKDDAYITELRSFIGHSHKLNNASKAGAEGEHSQLEVHLQRDNNEVTCDNVVGNFHEDVNIVDIEIPDSDILDNNKSLTLSDSILESHQMNDN